MERGTFFNMPSIRGELELDVSETEPRMVKDKTKVFNARSSRSEEGPGPGLG